jgi:hypothetical protein
LNAKSLVFFFDFPFRLKASSFSLNGQRKRTKRKATRKLALRVPSNSQPISRTLQMGIHAPLALKPAPAGWCEIVGGFDADFKG